MEVTIYHRRAGAMERSLVENSGFLWGRPAAVIAGGGPACVKAYIGRLPEGKTGYSFTTLVMPTRTRRFQGFPSAVWCDGTEGVEDVPSERDCVMIRVEIVDE